MLRCFMKKYQDINASTIDQWVREGWTWGIPITSETYRKALNGEWEVVLTPTKAVPKHWFPNLKGVKVLGLASGGGQQMPIFAACEALCTVIDYSIKQLESEREIAKREGYEIDIVHGDMTKRLPFDDETFDIVFHPVSNCYVKDVHHVFKEAYRVLKKGGRLLSGLDNGINFIVDNDESSIVNALPFDPTTDETLYKKSIQDNMGIQFSHTLKDQIGGQLEAGFVLKDLYEDTNGEGHLHTMNIPTFLATYCIKY